MIYLVSRNKTLFEHKRYSQISFNEAMAMLLPLNTTQLDTETKGLDAHTKELLTVQLGCRTFQIVFDWTTLTKEEKLEIKNYLESDRLFIGHNIMFDIIFMYVQDIWIKYVYDTMIAEQLIYLGYPKILSKDLVFDLGIEFPGYEDTGANFELSYSLAATAKRRLGISIDKSVRGKIINEGLTEEVVVYAAGDVTYLEDIRDKQVEELEKQDLINAHKFECEFIKGLAYTKYCGVHLDPDKWKAKMKSDLNKLKDAIERLNNWVVEWDTNREHNGDWDIQYPELVTGNSFDRAKEVERLIKNGYKRSPADDLEVPYQSTKLYAYKKKVTSLFTRVNSQGDLFEGFDTKPKCVINWSSSKQVIPLFETLGINVDTFDKKTKKKKKSIEEKQIAPQKDKFPIIPIFLDYQEAAKVVSTYGENWLAAINPKTGRIHAELHSLGTDTGRISSGGGPYKVNLLNLPRDPVTRACFTAEKGNVWISADYGGQESAITASTSKDETMIHILSSGGDMHSEVAKACWPNILGNLTDDEVKSKYKHLRQFAKAVEFAIFYGGDDNTLVANSGFKPEDAKNIYTNFMAKFSGVKTYQDYCRKAVMSKGYILMNNVLRHRAHIFDAEWMRKVEEKFKEDGFWEYYREMKRDSPSCETVQMVKRYFKRKSESEKQSINYRIQNRGACAFKLSMIKLFNWICDNNYQNIVKICVTPYDEFNLECPEQMGDMVADVLAKCMIDGGKPFCPNVYLGADVARLGLCIKDFYLNDKLIMKVGDVIEVFNKTVTNITENCTYKESDLGKNYEDYVANKGPLPTYWIH